MAAITLKPIQPVTVTIGVVGTSPMLQHAWSKKAEEQMLMTPSERKKQPKVARNPEEEAEGACYRMDDGTPALSALSFKASLISAAHKDLGIEKTLVRKAMFLPNQAYEGPMLLTPLISPKPYFIREDFVRVGNSQTDIRYRPQYDEWSAVFTVQLDVDILNQQDLVNLINRAGFSVGIGEWRPEKGGEMGRFRFDTDRGITSVTLPDSQAA